MGARLLEHWQENLTECSIEREMILRRMDSEGHNLPEIKHEIVRFEELFRDSISSIQESVERDPRYLITLEDAEYIDFLTGKNKSSFRNLSLFYGKLTRESTDRDYSTEERVSDAKNLIALMRNAPILAASPDSLTEQQNHRMDLLAGIFSDSIQKILAYYGTPNAHRDALIAHNETIAQVVWLTGLSVIEFHYREPKAYIQKYLYDYVMGK